MSDQALGPRRDFAVIMARGQSSRLGYPKGLAVLGPGQPPFLQAVNDLYQQLGLLRIIVTLPELVTIYQALLEGEPTALWLAESEGGDTARTLLSAWSFLRQRPDPPTHLWAHPVDLPLVKPSTLAIIGQQSVLHPEQVVRPVHDGQPGHPVVFPASFLESLFDAGPRPGFAGPMRELLDRFGPAGVLTIPIQDLGIIRDFDGPHDLANF